MATQLLSRTPPQESRAGDIANIASELSVIEITSKTRSAALRRLSLATEVCNGNELNVQDLVVAVEEREQQAQTVVAPGFAIPQAFSNWDGEFRAILGRSKYGVDFGATEEAGLVHLILLLVVGKRGKKNQLAYLTAFADFFSEATFRDKLINASGANAIEHLIRERAGLVDTPVRYQRPKINRILLQQAMEIVFTLSGQAILISADKLESIPWKTLADWEGRVLVVTSDTQSEKYDQRGDTHIIDVPKVSLARTDRANLGLLLAASKGLVSADADVVCLTGYDGRRLDSLFVLRPQAHFEHIFQAEQNDRRKILPSVILRAIAISLEIAEQGREGKPIGTSFVIGDARQIQRHTKQLVLNPFHGYSKNLRSILDPSLCETIKEYSQLDGAFVVQRDGMVVSAGTYIIPKSFGNKLTAGLGTRHQAAASITSHTDAVAIVVSQSTGTVVVFRRGKIALKLERMGAVRTA